MFKKILLKIRKNELLKTSFYSGIGTFINFISGFVVHKVIAIVSGPSGIALVGQYFNFITISTSLANAGIQDGIVKYTSEYKSQQGKLTELFSSSARLTLVFSFLLSVLIFIFSEKLSIYLLKSSEFRYILYLFGISIFLFSLNRMLVSILNGMGEIKKYVLSNISTSLFALVVTTLASIFYGIDGALVAISFSQFTVFFITLAFVIKSKWFKFSMFTEKLNNQVSYKLFGFSLMSLTSLVLPPIVQIGIRNFIIQDKGIEDAGLWDAMIKISNTYLSIITTTLSVYFLPKLSSLTDRNEIRLEILNGYKIIIPILICIGIVFIVLREFIVLLLFTPEFLSIKSFFFPQFIGDFFKISSWIVAFLMLAKAKTKLFISTQLFFSAFTYISSIYFINHYGLIGAFWANAIKYFIYLVLMLIIFRKYIVKS